MIAPACKTKILTSAETGEATGPGGLHSRWHQNADIFNYLLLEPGLAIFVSLYAQGPHSGRVCLNFLTILVSRSQVRQQDADPDFILKKFKRYLSQPLATLLSGIN